MTNIDLIVYRIAKKKADPETLFEKTFIKVKKYFKDYSERIAKEAIISIENTLKADFKSHGYNAEIHVRLGKFRGHLYILRKVIGDGFVRNLADSGCVQQPIKVI